MSLAIGIVGATGAVGRECLRILEQRKLPVSRLRLYGSERSAGGRLAFAGADVPVETVGAGSFRALDAVILSAGATVARRLVPQIVKEGALAIDNSSAFREDPAVPLVVPEVNGERLAEHRGVVANPNCTAAILVVALAPLHRAAGVRRVIVASYQAVSGAGARAMEECRRQTRDVLEGRTAQAPEILPRPIAFNLFPQVGAFEADGRTGEEAKVERETRRILEAPDVAVDAICVRVPVLRCHSEAVTIELARPITPAKARELWSSAPGVHLVDDPARGAYPTPLDVEGTDAVAVGRVRASSALPGGLSFWCVGDQLRKGAALNAIQILERALAVSARPDSPHSN